MSAAVSVTVSGGGYAQTSPLCLNSDSLRSHFFHGLSKQLRKFRPLRQDMTGMHEFPLHSRFERVVRDLVAAYILESQSLNRQRAKAVKSKTKPHIGPKLRFKEKEKMDEKSVFDAKPQAAAWPSATHRVEAGGACAVRPKLRKNHR